MTTAVVSTQQLWVARGKVVAALHALARPEPDAAEARRLLVGAVEAVEAAFWSRGSA